MMSTITEDNAEDRKRRLREAYSALVFIRIGKVGSPDQNLGGTNVPTMSHGAAHGSVTQDFLESNFIDQNRDNPRRHMAGTQASQEHRVRRPHSMAPSRHLVPIAIS